MSQRLNFARLLGFETLGALGAGPVDFSNDTLSAKLGAKVGEPVGPGDSRTGDREVQFTPRSAARPVE